MWKFPASLVPVLHFIKVKSVVRNLFGSIRNYLGLVRLRSRGPI